MLPLLLPHVFSITLSVKTCYLTKTLGKLLTKSGHKQLGGVSHNYYVQINQGPLELMKNLENLAALHDKYDGFPSSLICMNQMDKKAIENFIELRKEVIIFFSL